MSALLSDNTPLLPAQEEFNEVGMDVDHLYLVVENAEQQMHKEELIFDELEHYSEL